MALNPPLTVPTTWADGQVLFASALNGDFQALLNWINSNGRIAITSNITIYVSSTGGGNGLTPGSPLGSITEAYNLLLAGYSFVNQSAVVTISVAAGTYNENVVISGLVPGTRNPGNIIISGNTGTPSSISVIGTPAFTFNHGSQCTVQGLQVSSPGGDGFFAHHYTVTQFQAIDFATCAASHWKAWDASIIQALGNYTITGNASSHIHANGSGTNLYCSFHSNPNQSPSAGPTVTLSGSRTFSNAFALSSRNAVLSFEDVIFSTTAATGPQYFANDNGTIFTGTSGAMTLPGNAPGSVANGGIYD